MKNILTEIMKVTHESVGPEQVIVLGHPLPDTDWWKFVRQLVGNDEIEVGKLVQKDVRTGQIGTIWRIALPTKVAAKFQGILPAKMKGPEPEVRAYKMGKPKKFKPLEGYFLAADVTTIQNHTVVFGLPVDKVKWKRALREMLAGSKVVEIFKSYQPDGRDLAFTWRIIIVPGGDRGLLVGARNPGAQPVVPQPQGGAKQGLPTVGSQEHDRLLRTWMSRFPTRKPKVNTEVASQEIADYQARVQKVKLNKLGQIETFPILGSAGAPRSDRLRFADVDSSGSPTANLPAAGASRDAIVMTIDAPRRTYKDREDE